MSVMAPTRAYPARLLTDEGDGFVRQRVAREQIEERVLSGIEEHLGDPSSWLNMSENTVARCAN